MTLAERLIEEGYRAGLKEGRAIGLAEGRAAARLLLQMRAKFGKVPARVVARLNTADKATLDRWAERVPSATKPADVIDD